MKFGCTELTVIDTEQVWLIFSPEDEQQAWPQDGQYSYEAAYWNAYLNRLCLNAFMSWLKEYLEFTEPLEVWPSEDEFPKLWELVNGTAIQLGETRIVLIPSEAVDIEEFCVQQEWIDLPSWVANYYVLVQVNPDNRWLRVLGYATHQMLKQNGKYNKITRTYSLEREDLIEDLNVMWMAREFCRDEKAKVEPLPKLSLVEVRKLVEQLKQPFWCSPRLSVEFKEWGALLADEHSRQELYNCLLRDRAVVATESITTTVTADIVPSSELVNLSQWFQRNFEKSWRSIEELLGPRESNLAFAFRGNPRFKEPTSEQTPAIPALIELLHGEPDEEKRLKAAECLGAIAPGNKDAITTLIELLNTSHDKWTKYQATESLGRIGFGNPEAIAALTKLLHSSKDDDLRWQAALSLGQLDPSHPKAGVGRGRHIDLGMQLGGHPVALLVAIAGEEDEEVGVLLRVRPTGGEIYLPAALELIVLDESGEVFEQAQARSADNWVQLQFSVGVGDRFSVKVVLGDASHTEEFGV
ncbi:DUF1822 family protein [Microcoleus sp.]|uniref:DUF1822 family protein n=1 Tax=Microcoleus sp. TaxID=44472 RepID=UPI003524FCCF